MTGHLFYRRYLAFWAAVAVLFIVYLNWYLYQPQGAEITPPELDHWWKFWHPAWFSWPQAIVLLLPAVTYNVAASRRLGGLKSHLGRAVAFLTLGVIAWAGVGNLIFFSYQLAGKEVPYPGLPDIGYIGLMPLYAVGLFSLSKLAGITKRDVLRLAWIPVIAVAVVYALTLPTGGVGPEWVLGNWKDIAGDAVAQTSVLYLSVDLVLLPWAVILLACVRNVAGGLFYPPMTFVVASLLCHVGADMLFNQRIASGYYYTGDVASILYFGSMYLMMYAIYRFSSVMDSMTVAAPTTKAVAR